MTNAAQLIKQAAYELQITITDLKEPDDPLAIHQFTIKRKDGSDCTLNVAGNATFEIIHALIKDNCKSANSSVLNKLENLK